MSSSMIHRTPASTATSSTNGREKNGNGNSSSWRLPLHHASSPAAAAAAATKATSHTSSSSSNFLMGGSYYPGKDKASRRGAAGRLLNRKRRGSSMSRSHFLQHWILSPFQRLLTAMNSPRYHSNNNKQRRRRKAVLAIVIFLLCIVIIYHSTSTSSTSNSSRRRHWAEQLPIVRSIVQGKRAWWWKRDILDQLQKSEAVADTTVAEKSSIVISSSSSTVMIHLPTQRQALAMAEELQLERQRMDSQQQHPKDSSQHHDNKPRNRLELLEKIVPEWYHRNDQKKTTPKQQQPTNTQAEKQGDEKQKEQQPNRVTKANASNNNNNNHSATTMHQQSNIKKETPVSPIDKSEAATVVLSNTSSTTTTATTTTTTRIVRTLHTMDWENVTRHNHCPTMTTSQNLDDHDDVDDDQNIQITLVTQSSLDRAWILDETCLRWNTDPIIAVIAMEPHQHQHSNQTTNHDNKNKQEMNNNMISILSSGWQQKCPHLIIIPYTLSQHEAIPANYPVNHLRNLALDAVQTSHVLVVDVDFVPSLDLAHDIRQALLLRRRVRRQQQKQQQGRRDDEYYYNAEYYDALVVPAFERILNIPCATVDDCKSHLRHNHSFIPNTFDELRACVKEQNCHVFQSSNNWEGHYSTRSQRWLAQDWYEEEINNTTSSLSHANNRSSNVADNTTTTTLHDVKSIPCFDSLRYEPYVVIRWCPSGSSSSAQQSSSSNDTTAVRPVAPYYDERFHGYGKNKIEFIAHLRLAFYQFAILPRGFIVHNPHVESKSKQAWNNVSSSAAGGVANNNNLHMDMDRLYPVFLKELIQKYHHMPNNNNNLSKNTTNHQSRHPEHIVDSCQ